MVVSPHECQSVSLHATMKKPWSIIGEKVQNCKKTQKLLRKNKGILVSINLILLSEDIMGAIHRSDSGMIPHHIATARQVIPLKFLEFSYLGGQLMVT